MLRDPLWARKRRQARLKILVQHPYPGRTGTPRAVRGGDLVQLVSLVCLVCLV